MCLWTVEGFIIYISKTLVIGNAKRKTAIYRNAFRNIKLAVTTRNRK